MSSGGFLTADELAYLTERQKPSAQARILARQGIAYQRGANGHLRVAWSALGTRPPLPRATPDWAALERMG